MSKLSDSQEQSPFPAASTDQASSLSQVHRLPAPHEIDLPTPPSTEDDQLEAPQSCVPSKQVQDVLRALRLRRQGSKWVPPSAWPRYPLTNSEYDQVRRILRDEEPDLDGYIQDKLRCDYFRSDQYLVIRMPSVLHEIFTSVVAADITAQLRAIAASASPSAELAKDIIDCRSSKLEPLDTDYEPHEPDTSFKHVAAGAAAVVLETSYSQKRKDLPKLADEYILGTNMNVQLVVGLDIEYRGKGAALSMWKPERQPDDEDQEAEYGFVKQFVIDQVHTILQTKAAIVLYDVSICLWLSFMLC